MLYQVDDLSVPEVYQLFKEAENPSPLTTSYKKSKVALLFFAPSTRTKISFELALEENCHSFVTLGSESSSIQKGESAFDSILTLKAMGIDKFIVRTKEKELGEILKEYGISFINAGMGIDSHPTQALLDALTIYQQFKTFTSLKVGLIGDTKFSRVAKSNIRLLSILGCDLYVCSPEDFCLENNEETISFISREELVEICDVIMILRPQFESHDGLLLNKKNYMKQFKIDCEHEKMMKKESIIMHPGPVLRNFEISSELISCKRSKIFQQIKNGVSIRTALIKKMWEGK